MTLTTDCAKCGKPLMLQNCNEAGYRAFNMERFLNRILCERCSKYHKRSKWLAKEIQKMAERLFVLSRRPNAVDIRRQMRLDMLPVVGDFVTNAAEYYRVMAMPAPDVTDAILQAPHLWAAALSNVVKDMAGRTEFISPPKH